MITLSEACKIAKKELESETTFIKPECRDLSDSWCFDWGWKKTPQENKVGLPELRVYKATGNIEDFPKSGIPTEEEFQLMENALKINISEYI